MCSLSIYKGLIAELSGTRVGDESLMKQKQFGRIWEKEKDFCVAFTSNLSQREFRQENKREKGFQVDFEVVEVCRAIRSGSGCHG